MKPVQIGYTFLQGFVKHFRKHLCCFPGAPTLNLIAISSSDPRRWAATPLGPLGSSRPSPWAPAASPWAPLGHPRPLVGLPWLLLGPCWPTLGPPLVPPWLALGLPLASLLAPLGPSGRPLMASPGLSNFWVDFRSYFGSILVAF